MQEHSTPRPQTVSQLYPSKYLTAADLQGKRYSLTIQSASVEKMRLFDGTQGWRVVLTFKQTQKCLVLNKTQCKALVAITGNERFATWTDVTIELAPATAQNNKATIAIHRVSKSDSSGTSEKPVPVPEIQANGYHD